MEPFGHDRDEPTPPRDATPDDETAAIPPAAETGAWWSGKRLYAIIAGAVALVALVGGVVAVRLLSNSEPTTTEALPTTRSPGSTGPSASAGTSATATASTTTSATTSATPSGSSTTTSPRSSSGTTPTTGGGGTTAPTGGGGGGTTPPTGGGSTPPTGGGETPPACVPGGSGGGGGNLPGWSQVWSADFTTCAMPSQIYADMGGPCPPSLVTFSAGLMGIAASANGCTSVVRTRTSVAAGAAVEIRARANHPSSGSVSPQIAVFDQSGEVGGSIRTVSSGFHTYRAEWAGGQVTWYVDGQAVQSNVNFPSRAMAIMLTVSGSGLSQTHNAFEIDYMTVYQQST